MAARLHQDRFSVQDRFNAGFLRRVLFLWKFMRRLAGLYRHLVVMLFRLFLKANARGRLVRAYLRIYDGLKELGHSAVRLYLVRRRLLCNRLFQSSAVEVPLCVYAGVRANHFRVQARGYLVACRPCGLIGRVIKALYVRTRLHPRRRGHGYA